MITSLGEDVAGRYASHLLEFKSFLVSRFALLPFWCHRRAAISDCGTSRRLFEPRHDKTNKVAVRPAKTQISLGICPV